MMKLKRLVIFIVMTGCTPQKSLTSEAGPKSCQDRTSADECTVDSQCIARYGEDLATAEEIFMACTPAGPSNPDCFNNKACYTNSLGQRAMAMNCEYPRWTEVVCKAEELAPCSYTTAAECETDKRCRLNPAKDLTTKESIAMGCGYINSGCNAALSCYVNKLTGTRVLANHICKTPFPEWEYSDCTQADYEASKVQ